MTLSQRIEALLPIVAVIADSTIDEVRAEIVAMIAECDLDEAATEHMLRLMIGSDADN